MALLMLENYVTFYKSLMALSWNVLCSLCSFKCYVGGKYAISNLLHRRWPSLSSIFRTFLFQCTWSSVLPNMLSCIEFLFQSVNRNFFYVNTSPKLSLCTYEFYLKMFAHNLSYYQAVKLQLIIIRHSILYIRDFQAPMKYLPSAFTPEER